MEFLYGTYKSQAVCHNLDVIEGPLERIEVLDFDLGAAEHAGQIRTVLAVAGTTIRRYGIMMVRSAVSDKVRILSKSSRRLWE
jgi:tRNA(fMet)-specific endonuclease VapC